MKKIVVFTLIFGLVGSNLLASDFDTVKEKMVKNMNEKLTIITETEKLNLLNQKIECVNLAKTIEDLEECKVKFLPEQI